MKYIQSYIKGFVLYILIVTAAFIAYAITWLKKEDKDDERIGYESGRIERD